MQLILITDKLRISIKESIWSNCVPVHFECGNEFYDVDINNHDLATILYLAVSKAMGIKRDQVSWNGIVAELKNHYFQDDKIKFCPI